MDELGVDFAGYQDHSLNGGCDVKTLGYQEFIPVLIKAIQDLHAQIPEYNPSIITKLQCKKQAVVEGLWSGIKAAMDANPEMKENWDLAGNLNINDADVQAMGVLMGKTPEQLQAFFDAAKLL